MGLKQCFQGALLASAMLALILVLMFLSNEFFKKELGVPLFVERKHVIEVIVTDKDGKYFDGPAVFEVEIKK